MLIVDEAFIKRLNAPFELGKNPVPEIEFSPPREWHQEKLCRFVTQLKAQLDQKQGDDSVVHQTE